jgi:hypothetical protein
LVRFIWLGTNQDQSFATLFLVVNQSLPAITGFKILFLTRDYSSSVIRSVMTGFPRVVGLLGRNI